MSDDEFPELAALISRPTTKTAKTSNTPSSGLTLRRSPRKQRISSSQVASNLLEDVPSLIASSQQRSSPRKQSSPRRAPVKGTQPKARREVLGDVPELAPIARIGAQRDRKPAISLLREDSDDGFAIVLKPLSNLSLHKDAEDESASEKENAWSSTRAKRAQPTSKMSRITQAAKHRPTMTKQSRPAPKKSNPYVSQEAHCEDLNESSGTDGEDEDTDLSGFVVEDEAELSFHGSAIEISSDSEEEKTTKQRRQKSQASPKRRLIRGRRKQLSDSEEDVQDDQGLAKALDNMNLGGPTLQKQKNTERKKTLDVIDLTKSSPCNQNIQSRSRSTKKSNSRWLIPFPASTLLSNCSHQARAGHDFCHPR